MHTASRLAPYSSSVLWCHRCTSRRITLGKVQSLQTSAAASPTSPAEDDVLLSDPSPAVKGLESDEAPAAEHAPPKKPKDKKSVKNKKTARGNKGAEVVERTIRADLIKQQTLSSLKTAEPPCLAHGLDRVLFDPGTVFRLQCPRTGRFNFLPTLKSIPHISRFKAHLLPPYSTPYEDTGFRAVYKDPARRDNVRFVGATSTCTAMLQHLHYLISCFRPLNLDQMSRMLTSPSTIPTKIQLVSHSFQLRNVDSGQYVINSDFQLGTPVRELMRVGHLLELKMTASHEEFSRWIMPETNQSDIAHDGAAASADDFESTSSVAEPEPAPEPEPEPQSHNYTQFGSFLVRSQLDARHPELSLTRQGGYFDIKTRAVLPVRMDPLERHAEARNYSLSKLHGNWSSYERELYDLSRTMLLKYSLQARLGNMDGIFIAWHNLQHVLGFQYLSLPDMDEILHGQRDDLEPLEKTLGTQELKMSFMILEKLFDTILRQTKGQDVYIHFDSVRSNTKTELFVFAEPINDELLQHIDSRTKAIETRNAMINLAWKSSHKSAKDGDVDDMAAQLSRSTQAHLEFLEQTQIAYEQDRESVSWDTIHVLARAHVGLVGALSKLASEVDTASVQQRAAVRQHMDLAQQAIRLTESWAQELPDRLQHEAFGAANLLRKGTVRVNELPALRWTHLSPDLQGYRITVQNCVNGQNVTRVQALEPEDKWTLTYEIKTLEHATATNMYAVMMNRKLALKDDSRIEELYHGKWWRDMQLHAELGPSGRRSWRCGGRLWRLECRVSFDILKGRKAYKYRELHQSAL